jgi:hypothetical protein
VLSLPLKEIETRKAVLVRQSQLLRQDFTAQAQPIKVWLDKAELGFRLARQGKDVLLLLTPALLAMATGRGGMLKGGLALLSNWRVLKKVWEGFRGMKEPAP